MFSGGGEMFLGSLGFQISHNKPLPYDPNRDTTTTIFDAESNFCAHAKRRIFVFGYRDIVWTHVGPLVGCTECRLTVQMPDRNTLVLMPKLILAIDENYGNALSGCGAIFTGSWRS